MIYISLHIGYGHFLDSINFDRRMIFQEIFVGLRKCNDFNVILDDKDLEYLQAACFLHNIGIITGKKGIISSLIISSRLVHITLLKRHTECSIL